jgi:hypothetical protein
MTRNPVFWEHAVYPFGANCAASFAAWGSAPGTMRMHKTNSAEGAAHPKHLSDTRHVWDYRDAPASRAFSATYMLACFPGALPQATYEVAPLALVVGVEHSPLGFARGLV